MKKLGKQGINNPRNWKDIGLKGGLKTNSEYKERKIEKGIKVKKEGKRWENMIRKKKKMVNGRE